MFKNIFDASRRSLLLSNNVKHVIARRVHVAPFHEEVKNKKKSKKGSAPKGEDNYKKRLFNRNPPGRLQYMNVQNKIAIITGGNTGIGLAVAYELLTHGLHCVVCSGEDCIDRTKSVKKLNERFGKGKAVYFPTDVKNDLDFNRLFQYAIGRFNRVDILFNNATLWTDCQWESCIDSNICSIGRGSLLAMDYMGANKNGCGGIVVNCGSTLSFDCVPSCPAYCASQHAIVSLTESFGDSFHSKDAKLRFVSLCPGVTVSGMSHSQPHITHGVRLCKMTENWMKKQSRQDTLAVAKSFIYIVKYGKSGHHYVIDGSVLSECVIPAKEDFATPICYFKHQKNSVSVKKKN